MSRSLGWQMRFRWISSPATTCSSSTQNWQEFDRPEGRLVPDARRRGGGEDRLYPAHVAKQQLLADWRFYSKLITVPSGLATIAVLLDPFTVIHDARRSGRV